MSSLSRTSPHASECGKFLLVKSGIQQIVAVKSEILGSEESGIPLTISIRNPVREIQSLAFPYVGRKTYDTQLKRKQIIKADSHFQPLQSHLIHRQP